MSDSGFNEWKPGCISGVLLWFLFTFTIGSIASLIKPQGFNLLFGLAPWISPFLVFLFFKIANQIRYDNYTNKKERERILKEEDRERARKIAELELTIKKNQEDYIKNLTKDLCSHENSINMYSNQLGIEFPVNYMKDINDFVDKHKNEDVTKISNLTNLVDEGTKKAKEDKINLEKAINLFDSAKNIYESVKFEVYKTSNFARFLEELDYCYQGLNLKDLKLLLTKKQWQDYNEIVTSIIADIKRIQNEAANQQNSKSLKTDLEVAYQILGLNNSVTNDEIKIKWRRLSSEYHPDRAEQTTESIKKLAEERLKDINWAYEILKEERQFK